MRVLQSAPATVSVTFKDQHGEPAAAAGTVTVTITTADGTAVVTGAATAAGTGTGQYQYALTAAQLAQLNTLTAVWYDGTTARATTIIDVVGDVYVTLAEMRAFHRDLANASVVSDQRLYDARDEAELECELCTGVAFVPHYSRVRSDGDATKLLPTGLAVLRAVRSVRTYAPGYTSYTAFSAAELAALDIRDGTLRRTDSGVFQLGVGNIVAELEHGLTAAPADIKRAVLTRIRAIAAEQQSAIPQRATEWKIMSPDGMDGGGIYRFAQPDMHKTGFPDVDAVYGRYAELYGGAGGDIPTSRGFDFDPQRASMFHGGRR